MRGCVWSPGERAVKAAHKIQACVGDEGPSEAERCDVCLGYAETVVEPLCVRWLCYLHTYAPPTGLAMLTQYIGCGAGSPSVWCSKTLATVLVVILAVTQAATQAATLEATQAVILAVAQAAILEATLEAIQAAILEAILAVAAAAAWWTFLLLSSPQPTPPSLTCDRCALVTSNVRTLATVPRFNHRSSVSECSCRVVMLQAT